MPKWVIVLLVAGPLAIIGVATAMIMRPGNSSGDLVPVVSTPPEKKAVIPTQPQVPTQYPDSEIANRLAKLEQENQRLREQIANQNSGIESRLIQLQIENQTLKSQIASQNATPVVPVKPTPSTDEMREAYTKTCEPFLESLDKIESDFQVSAPQSKIKDDVAAAITAYEAWKRNAAVVKTSYPSKQELEDSIAGYRRYQERQSAADELEAQIMENKIAVVEAGMYNDYIRDIDQAYKDASDACIEGQRHLFSAKDLLAAADELAAIKHDDEVRKQIEAADAASRSKLFGTTSSVRSVVYICDGSESMNQNGKAEVLKNELKHDIGQLDPGQSFNVLIFQDPKFIALDSSLLAASDGNKRFAFDFIDNLQFRRTTSPIPALAEGLSEGPDLMYFVTDGHFANPSVQAVLDSIDRLNQNKKVRVSTILLLGMHAEKDAYTQFEGTMARISADNGGDRPKKLYAEDFLKK